MSSLNPAEAVWLAGRGGPAGMCLTEQLMHCWPWLWTHGVGCTSRPRFRFGERRLGEGRWSCLGKRGDLGGREGDVRRSCSRENSEEKLR